MRLRAGLIALMLAPAAVGAEDPAVTACLSCHLTEDGALDIIGVQALTALPPEWPFLFEDEFDLDGDGIAGRLRFVSGDTYPRVAKYGASLAAARFEDFAKIAAAAHDIDISGEGTLARIEEAFEALSPAPTLPFASPAQQSRFEARGCAGCHVTETYEFDGVTFMPLSDFLLHDLGDGPKRTAPLWGCPACLEAPPHNDAPQPLVP